MLMLALDIECYTNYFLVMFKHIGTGDYRYFEAWPEKPLDPFPIIYLMENYTTISFNGLSYDLPLIKAALEGFSNAALKSFSDNIIKTKGPSWAVAKKNNIEVPLNRWDHVDLIHVAPGKAGLKLYGGRMHAPRIQDLPIKPDEIIRPEDAETIRTYCMNDVDTTELLYKTLMPQIALRISMSEQYGMDLRSKSDAQIAETVIKSELEKKTGRKYKSPKEQKGRTVRYQNPQIVTFQTPALQNIFQKILDHEFSFKGNDAIVMPDWLKPPISIGNASYNMGIGGLHSCEKSQLIRADGNMLADLDVSSYYPSIILQQKLSPKYMGNDFLTLYQSIVTRRLTAKAKMQKIAKEISKLEEELKEFENNNETLT